MILKTKLKYLEDLLIQNKSKKFFIKDYHTSNNLSQLKEKFNYIVSLLIKRKFKKNDRVLIVSKNRTEIFLIQFAVSYLGGVSSTVDEDLKYNAYNYIFNDLRPKILFIDQNSIIKRINIFKNCEKIFFQDLKFKKKKLEKNNIKRNKNDLVIIIYTSGTTGNPKGIMCSHQNIIFSIYSIQSSLKYNSEDRIAVFLPLSFDYGMYQVFMGLAKGSKIFLAKINEISFNYLNFIKKNSITILPLVSSHLRILLTQIRNKKINLKLRLITNTGSELRNDLVRIFFHLYRNVKVYSMYGLTECKRVSILDAKEYFKKHNSVGKPIKGTRCWIIDKKGKKINKPGTKGELVVQGKHVTIGYLNDDHLTKKKFKAPNTLYTGDICSLDRNGYLYFFGRKDDIFKYKDYRLSKKEIEKNINEINQIKDTFVHVDENFKNYTIYIVTKLNLGTAIKKIKDKLEHYKFTENIIKINDIKRDQRGKISKNFVKKLIR